MANHLLGLIIALLAMWMANIFLGWPSLQEALAATFISVGLVTLWEIWRD